MACEEYFVPEIERQQSVMVFEGFITDQQTSHVIKISKSQSFNEDSVFYGLGGFNVQIEDEFGNSINFQEGNNGLYNSDSMAQGSIGTRYRMVAIAPSGKTYLSQWELLGKSSSIDSIYGAYEEQNILKYYEYTGYVEERIEGMKVLMSENTANGSSFYRYEYDIVFQSTNYYPTVPLGTLVYIVSPASSTKKDFIALANSNLYSQNIIIDNKVDFISSTAMNNRIALDSIELDSMGEPLFEPNEIRFQQRGFLIRINQFSLSESGFEFWNAINKQSNSTGQIFDPVNAQIKGNIYCDQDSSEVVFGYFGASSFSQKSMALYINSSRIVDVEPVKYFPELNYTKASRTVFDFWINF
jgi:hypothetical protein